ncbi:hypothetical protein HK096_007769, partial [Nowakowskiella sp. JEL0078]
MASSLVFQIGSFSAKAGFADYQQLPSVIAFKSLSHLDPSLQSIDPVLNENVLVPFCGDLLSNEIAAERKKALLGSTSPRLGVRKPVSNGVITDWEAFEALCKHIL